MNIILASKSPRRIEILSKHNVEALVMPTETDESLPEGIGMTEAVEMLAKRKADSCYAMVAGKDEYAGHTIVAADTIVWKDELMGKPEDRADARRMLESIRGTYHYVVTGIAVIDVDTGSSLVRSDITEVWCKDYTDEELDDYLATDEPYDKAGSYAIQGLFGRHIDHIEGDYENVVGLPYHLLADMLGELEKF